MSCVVHNVDGSSGCVRAGRTVSIEGKVYAAEQADGAWCPVGSATAVPWEACSSGYCANTRCTPPPCDVTTAGPKNSVNEFACPAGRACVASGGKYVCTMQDPVMVGGTYYRRDLDDGAVCPVDAAIATPWPGCRNGFCRRNECTRIACSQTTAGPDSGGDDGSGKPCRSGMTCVKAGSHEYKCTTGSSFAYGDDFFATSQGDDAYCPLSTGKIEPYGGCESGHCYANKCTDLNDPSLGTMRPNRGRTLHVSTNGPKSKGRDVDGIAGTWSETAVHITQEFVVDFTKQGDSTGLHLRLYKSDNPNEKRRGWVIEKEVDDAVEGPALTLLYYTVKCDADPGSMTDMEKGKIDLCKNAWIAVADEGGTPSVINMSIRPGATPAPNRTKNRRLRVKACGDDGKCLHVSGIYHESSDFDPDSYGAAFLKEGDENLSLVLDKRYKEGNPWYGWHFIETIQDPSDPTNTYKFQYNSPFLTVGCNRIDPSQCYELWDRSAKKRIEVNADIFSEVDAHERRRVKVTSKTGDELKDRIFNGTYTETFDFDGTLMDASFVKDNDDRVCLNSVHSGHNDQGWMLSSKLSDDMDDVTRVSTVKSKSCRNKDPWKCKGHEFPYKVTVDRLSSTSHSVAPSPGPDNPNTPPLPPGPLQNIKWTIAGGLGVALFAGYLMTRRRRRR